MSFQIQLTKIHQMITELSEITFENDINTEFVNNKIKTNLRHAQERFDRATSGEKKSSKSSTTTQQQQDSKEEEEE